MEEDLCFVERAHAAACCQEGLHPLAEEERGLLLPIFALVSACLCSAAWEAFLLFGLLPLKRRRETSPSSLSLSLMPMLRKKRTFSIFYF